MDTKLTLKLSADVISKAKEYARLHKVSLSKMIETYLLSLTDKNEDEKREISPIVDGLSGVIELPDDFDAKKDYRDFLQNKYR
jgi:hypothetical protein